MKSFTLLIFALFISALSWQGNASNSGIDQYLQLDNGTEDAYSTNRATTSIIDRSALSQEESGPDNSSVRAFDNLLIVQLYTQQNYNNGGSVHDSFGIHFDVNNNNDLTPVDAVKPMNFFENLGINHNGTLLSFESREMPQVDEVFSMFSSGYQSTEYVLKIIVDGLANTVFYLEDNYTNTSTMFETGTIAYSFTVSSSFPLSKATNRFSIRVDAAPSDYNYENGAWTPGNPSGVSSAIDNIRVINGTASLNADTEVGNITIQAGATLEVHNVLTLNGNIANTGHLVFVSSATGNGELAAVSGSSSIMGNTTVQRYISNNRSYRMVSSPVTTTTSIKANWQEGATSNTNNPAPGFGTHITGSTIDQENGFDGTDTGNFSMFTVNVGAQAFEAITNTDVNTLTAGEAYLLFVRGDRSINLSDPNNNVSSATVLRATGSLTTGAKSQSFNATDGDFVMFGNPYQSAVDVASVFSNSTNIYPLYYYVYDPTRATYGAYVTVNTSDGFNNFPGSTANQYLQPGQAAQVKVSDNATILFNESDKAPGNFTATNRNPMLGNDMLTVQLFTTENFNNGESGHDSFVIRFAEGNDNRLTPADAVKPMNFYENLAIDQNGTYLSIAQREMPQLAEVYPLYTSGYQHSEYTLKLTVDGLGSTFLYLDDHATRTSTLLETGDNVYSFSIDANDAMSIATGRFSIRTEQRLGVEDTSLLSGILLYPNPINGNTFYIKAPRLNGAQLIVNITDLSGRKIYEGTLDCIANTATVSLNSDLATGVYLATLKHEGETHTYRLIKE